MANWLEEKDEKQRFYNLSTSDLWKKTTTAF